MLTWGDYMKCKTLDRLCDEYGIIVSRHTDGQIAIGVDVNRHPNFVPNNLLKIVDTVEEAVAWIGGFLSVQWSSKVDI